MIIIGGFMKQTIFAALVISLALVSQNVAADTTTGTASIFSKNQKFDHEGVELYNNNLDMKSMKKIGAGLAAGGMMGMIGLNVEINLEPEDTLFLGLGTGKGFNTFNFGYKKNFEGYYMSPYTKVGLTRWSSASNAGNGASSGSDVLRQVLSDDEIRDNKFYVNFLAGGAGLEYNQLEGNLSGINLFGELLVLADISDFKLVPTGSVGITYFY
jgi:hypothetical protein